MVELVKRLLGNPHHFSHQQRTPCPLSLQCSGMQELMLGGLLNNAVPQPVDSCLESVGMLLSAPNVYPAVISPRWIPPLAVKSSTVENEVTPVLRHKILWVHCILREVPSDVLHGSPKLRCLKKRQVRGLSDVNGKERFIQDSSHDLLQCASQEPSPK